MNKNMGTPEGSIDLLKEEMEKKVGWFKSSLDLLLENADAGNWSQVSYSKIEDRVFAAKDGLTRDNIDDMIEKVTKVKELYTEANNKSEVPEEFQVEIHRMLSHLQTM
ncbi:MAG: hypothetical protein ACNFW9_02060 [Candidatus Kerfeldbacteria bacterium]